MLIDEERYADAASLLAASIERLRAAGDGRNVAVALNNWALAQLMLGHPESARATFQEARAAQQTQLDRRAVAIAGLNIALAAQDCRAHAEAIAEFSSALDDLDAFGARRHVASAAYAIAGLTAELGENEDATGLGRSGAPGVGPPRCGTVVARSQAHRSPDPAGPAPTGRRERPRCRDARRQHCHRPSSSHAHGRYWRNSPLRWLIAATDRSGRALTRVTPIAIERRKPTTLRRAPPERGLGQLLFAATTDA